MNKGMYRWFEELPEQCPPEDAIECNGIYFRIANGNPATSEDFFSQRKLQPDKIFKGEGIDDCIVENAVGHMEHMDIRINANNDEKSLLCGCVK